MSFGPERAGRRTASADSPIARTTRRILLTGGCVFAGWVGASALGGTAQAATASDAAPVSSVLSSTIGSTSHLANADQALHSRLPADSLSVPASLSRVDKSVHVMSEALGDKRPTSITVRSAQHPTAEHPTADLPVTPKPATRSGIGGALDSVSLGDQSDHLGGDVTGRLHSLDPAVKPVTDQIVKPVTDKIVAPVSSNIKPTTDQIVKPVSDTVKPITDAALHATQTVAAPGNGGVLAGLGGTLNSLTGHVHDISVPGLTATGPDQPTPVALNPRPIELPGQSSSFTPVVRSGATSAEQAGRTGIRAATPTAHPAATDRRMRQIRTSLVPAQRLLPAYATAVAGSGSQHNPIAVSGASRAPNGPIAPTAPQLPTGASTGSAPGSSLNNSGPTGGSPMALDSDADAPFRALGTVDPTDASMARSVAKRPCTSPD